MDAFDRAVEREDRARHLRRTRPTWVRFLIHLRIYVAVNAGLLGLWLVVAGLTADDSPFFMGSLIGWGCGVLIHYLVVTQLTREWKPPRSEAAPTRAEGGAP